MNGKRELEAPRIGYKEFEKKVSFLIKFIKKLKINF
jgi:hypothetical protein